MYCCLAFKSRQTRGTYVLIHVPLPGIQKQESVGNIKKIFRSLAREFHPDRRSNKDDDKAFKIIKEAHDILSDLTRRRFYDETGENSTDIYPETISSTDGQ